MKKLPFDCWCCIFEFIEGGRDFMNVILSHKELYENVITTNGWYLQYTTFYVNLQRVPDLWLKKIWTMVVVNASKSISRHNLILTCRIDCTIIHKCIDCEKLYCWDKLDHYYDVCTDEYSPSCLQCNNTIKCTSCPNTELLGFMDTWGRCPFCVMDDDGSIKYEGYGDNCLTK